MARTRKKGLGDTLIDLSNVLTSFSALGANLINTLGTPSQRVTHQLRTQGLALKNEKTAVQIAHEHEKIHLTIDKQVKSSYEIELLALKVQREKWAQKNAGIGAPTFQADNYPDPGDVRRGVIPPHNFPN